MDTERIAREIYDYTNGYPYLVSRICQLKKNTLFDSLMGTVLGNTEISRILERILFAGDVVSYNAYNIAVSDAEMYGFIQDAQGKVVISNRIFETLLYNYYLSVNEMKVFCGDI